MDKKKIEKIEEISKEVEQERQNIIDVLLDEENKDNIVLTDENGKNIAFEQIAVIPYNDKIYCVLKPIDKMEGVADDEAIVFFVHEEENKEPVLMVETDEKTAIAVFDEYYNLLDEADNNSSDKK